MDIDWRDLDDGKWLQLRDRDNDVVLLSPEEVKILTETLNACPPISTPVERSC